MLAMLSSTYLQYSNTAMTDNSLYREYIHALTTVWCLVLVTLTLDILCMKSALYQLVFDGDIHLDEYHSVLVFHILLEVLESFLSSLIVYVQHAHLHREHSHTDITTS